MQIIITKSFKKLFFKILKKEQDLKSFCNKLKIEDFINIGIPYQKYKFNISWISIRWVAIIHNNQINIIPLFIIKKSNKKYWMNLILNKEIKDFLNFKYDKAIRDIENDNFEIL